MIRAFHRFGHSYFHYVLTCLMLKVNLRLYPGSWQIWRGRYHHKHRSSPSRSQGTAPQVTQGPPRADTLGSGKDDGFPTKPALLSGTQQSHGKHAKVCTEFVTRKKHTTTKTTFIFFFCPGNMMDLEATVLFCKLSSLQHVLAASIPRDKHAGFFV